MGVDLAEYVKPVDNGIEVHAILSPQESQALRDKGLDVQDAVYNPATNRFNAVGFQPRSRRGMRRRWIRQR